MLSPNSLDAGSYTLTGWEHPAGRLLPVVLRPIGFDQIPAYLGAITFLTSEGDVAAGVADAVHRIALARWRARLKTMAIGVAAASVVFVGAYAYWMKRAPQLKTAGKDGAPAVVIPAGNFTTRNCAVSCDLVPTAPHCPDVFYVNPALEAETTLWVSKGGEHPFVAGGVKTPPAKRFCLFKVASQERFDAENKVALKVDSSSANPYAIIPTSVTGLLKEEDTELKAFKSSLLAKRSLKDNPTRAWFQ